MVDITLLDIFQNANWRLFMKERRKWGRETTHCTREGREVREERK